jgi:hypothetical protein
VLLQPVLLLAVPGFQIPHNTPLSTGLIAVGMHAKGFIGFELFGNEIDNVRVTRHML